MAEQQFITFYLDDRHFGVNIRLVREIYRTEQITPVALAPDFVTGLLNLRGQIVTVVNLRTRMGMAPTEMDRAECVVLRTSTELERAGTVDAIGDTTLPDHIGLLVDRIGDVVVADDSAIEVPPSHGDRALCGMLSGVIKLETDLLMIVSMAEVLTVDSDIPTVVTDQRGSGAVRGTLPA